MALSPNLVVIERAIEKASRSLVRDFTEVEKLQISIKGPGDFVSRADRRAEEMIVESLQRDRADWGILGEEGTSIKGKDDRYRFIIDPLDGTTNFLHGLPHWCITIALEKEGEIVAGMTFDPIRQEMFRAEKGGGAFMNNTRLSVAGRKSLQDSIISTNVAKPLYDSDSADQHAAMVSKILQAKCKIRSMSSGALDLAYVAAGRYDVAYMGASQKPWDIAVGLLLVREARGIVTNFDLQPATLAHDALLSGNATLHKAFADLIGLSAVR